MPLLQLKKVTKIYDPHRPNEFQALRDITFSIDRGELVAVMGPSGSGKSTLLHLLGCLDVVTSGQYILDREEVGQLSQRRLTKIRREKVGFVFQNFNLLPRLNAQDNVELPLVYRRIARLERTRRATAALESVGLKERRNYRPSDLSGGEQQRVAIARAIVGEPAIILADEPTGNLDSKTGGDIVRLLTQFHKQGRTVILVTHDERIAQHAQRRVLLADGQIVGK